MLVAERVHTFISEKRPDQVCDPCIAQALSLSRQARATPITTALGTTGDFVRSRGKCAICGHQRTVIQRV